MAVGDGYDYPAQDCRQTVDRRNGDARIARLRRRYHPIVWWVTLIHALFGLSYTLLVPMYRGPDEAPHVDMVRHYRSTTGYPDPTEHTVASRGVAASVAIMGPSAARPRPPQYATDAVPRPDRSTFAELDTVESPPRPNQMSQHPPVYYAITSSVTTLVSSVLPASTWTWDRELYLYRLMSWVSMAALPLLAAEGALAIGLRRRFTAVAASFPLLVPMATFIGAVANNDSLAVLFSGLGAVGALAYFNRGGARWAVLAAVGVAGAPLTKSTAAMVGVWAVGMLILGMVRHQVWRRIPAAIGHLCIVGVGALVGFSWHLANLVRFGDPQPNGFPPRVAPNSYAGASLLEFTPVWTKGVAWTFWGQPGRLTGVTLPFWMVLVLSAVAVAIVLVAVVTAGRRWPTWLLGVLVVAQVGLMFGINWRSYSRQGVFSALQGRYLFSLLVPIGVLAAIGVAALLRQRGTALVPAVGVVIAAVGIGLHAVLGWSMLTAGYWGGEGVSELIGAVVAWSPLPAALTLSVFAANAGVVIVAAVLHVPMTWRSGKRRGAPLGEVVRDCPDRPGRLTGCDVMSSTLAERCWRLSPRVLLRGDRCLGRGTP